MKANKTKAAKEGKANTIDPETNASLTFVRPQTPAANKDRKEFMVRRDIEDLLEKRRLRDELGFDDFDF